MNISKSASSPIPQTPAAAPEGLKLEKVQLIHRHGERTHVTERLRPFIPQKSLEKLYQHGCRRVAKLHRDVMKSGVEARKLDAHAESFPIHERDGVVFAPSIKSTDLMGVSIAMGKLLEQVVNAKDGCGLGQLTDVGKDTMSKLGAFWRTQYVDKHKLLPGKMDEHVLKLRSSDYARTFESLQYVVAGLYGEHATDGLHISTRPEHEESLHALENHCPRLKQLMKEFRKQVTQEFKPDLHRFGEKLQRYLPDDEKRRTNPFAIHDLYDSTAVLRAHGLPPLDGFEHEDWKFTEHFAARLWFDGFAKSMEALSLGMGPLMHDILQDLNSKGPAKAYIYSGHDTTIYPVLIALGVHDGIWPTYAANIAIETWRGKESYTRVLYNGKPMALPACQSSHLAGDATFCHLQAFQKLLQSVAVSPDEYAVKCNATE